MLAGLLQAMRPASLGALITACAMLGSTFAAPVLADDTVISLSIYRLPAASHNTAVPDHPVAAAPLERPAPEIRPTLALSRGDSRFALLEVPAEASVSGSYKRPHHAFG